jgi:CDP-diacylglycerol--glycerol-3-phosphate 3-phosphatidyltransferase
MLNTFARAAVSRVLDPVGAALIRVGLTPNAMTVLGTAGTVAASVWFFGRGQLLAGTFVVLAFVLFDLLDGAMARSSGQVTKFGTVLDASCDRIADGALFGALTWWCFTGYGHRALAVACLICLVAAQVISYIKARADATGLDSGGGLAERAERFIITLGGTALQGFGVPYALDVALWLLAVLAVVTVLQRLFAVRRSAARHGQEQSGV